MKYTIISSDDTGDLSELVNDAIREGWEPLGSVSVSAFIVPKSCGEYDYDHVLSQAMIRRDNPLEITNVKISSTEAESAREGLDAERRTPTVKVTPEESAKIYEQESSLRGEKLQTITKVRIVQAYLASDMEDSLNYFLEKGWKLYGDMFRIENCVNQMIIKEELEKNI